MNKNHQYSSDIAFTPTVKAIQERKGSRNNYANIKSGSYTELFT